MDEKIKYTPVLEIWQGKLRGIVKKDIAGNDYNAFMGIPYAKPPVGNLRFLAPKPAEKWTEEIYDSIKYKDICFQSHPVVQKISGSDDCLYLNVFSPKLNPSKLLPVMVWVCGGAFQFGGTDSETFGPEIFMTKEVVIVTLNYRVNIFGFLTLNDPELNITGNQGLKDQLEALRWVNKNIENFGGDPNNVTLFGESAGAASVHLHIFSQKSKNLIHKIILQSGCGLPFWATNGSYDVKNLMNIFNFDSSKDEKEFLNYLRQLNGKDIIETLKKIEVPETKNKLDVGVVPFSPTIETDSPEAFLTEKPETLLLRGDYHKIPTILGYNNDEGLLFTLDPSTITKISNDKLAFVPKGIKDKLKHNTEKLEKIANTIKKFYFNDQVEPISFPANIPEASKFLGDLLFNYDVFRSARLHSTYQKEPVYLFHLNLHTTLNHSVSIFHLDKVPFLKDANKLCTHCDDMGYMWFNSTIPAENYQGKLEKKFCDIITTFWTNFAKYSNPNVLSTGENTIDCEKWQNVDYKNVKYLEFCNDSVKMRQPTDGRVQFWDEIYENNQI